MGRQSLCGQTSLRPCTLEGGGDQRPGHFGIDNVFGGHVKCSVEKEQGDEMLAAARRGLGATLE